MEKNLLYRVDGGKVWGISMGHVRRASIVAGALARDFKIVFVMKDYADGVAYIRKSGFQVETIEISDDSDDTVIRICETHRPDRMIFDLNGTPYVKVFDYARGEKIRTIVFDVSGKCAGVPDVLVNDTIVKEFTRYPHLEGRAVLALGPEYFVMEDPPAAAPIRDSVDFVLITMGGSDPAGLTVKTLETLSGELSGLRMGVVLGPGFTEQARVRDIAGVAGTVDVFENPPDFMSLLSKSDVVITAAGRTLLECARLGRPCLVVPSIEHEEATAAEYCRLTGGFNTGRWDDDSTPGKIVSYLRQYRDSLRLRETVSAAALKLVDGAGLERVLALITG